MTAKTDSSERCPAIPRIAESIGDLFIFNVKTFINFMVCKTAPPNFLQNQLGVRILKNCV